MQLLLDSNILIAITRGEIAKLGTAKTAAISLPANECFASVVSLWEIAIKTRLGKLDPGMPLDELPRFLESTSIRSLAINERHAVADPEIEPDTRDPFDRMLLSQCQVEDMRLVTLDRKLMAHPLAWRPD